MPIELQGVVRASNETPNGNRLGFEFRDVPSAVRRVLIEFCLHAAARRSKGSKPLSQVADLTPVPPWRNAVQMLSLVGTAAGLSMLFAGPAAASGAPLAPGAICLVDSAGTPLAGAEAQYYNGGWFTLGVTGETGCVEGEIPAVNGASFRVTYEGLRNQLRQDTTVDSRVVFSTVPVVVSLLDSGGGPLSGGVVMFYGGSWQQFGVTDESGSVSKELLRQQTSFRVTYEGLRNQLRQDTTVDSRVVFSTVPVVVSLSDSGGGPLSGGVVMFYGGSWQQFGVTDESGSVSKELLRQQTSFRVTYEGLRNQLRQDTTVDSRVVFSTVPVVVSLLDSGGGPLSGGVVMFYGGSWQQFGVTDESGSATKELLGQRTTFRMTLGGLRVNQAHDTMIDPRVAFGTGAVVGHKGRVSQYWAGQWKPFVDGLELLPVPVRFRLEDRSSVTMSPVAGETIVVRGGDVLDQDADGSTASTSTSTTDPDSANTSSTEPSGADSESATSTTDLSSNSDSTSSSSTPSSRDDSPSTTESERETTTAPETSTSTTSSTTSTTTEPIELDGRHGSTPNPELLSELPAEAAESAGSPPSDDPLAGAPDDLPGLPPADSAASPPRAGPNLVPADGGASTGPPAQSAIPDSDGGFATPPDDGGPVPEVATENADDQSSGPGDNGGYETASPDDPSAAPADAWAAAGPEGSGEQTAAEAAPGFGIDVGFRIHLTGPGGGTTTRSVLSLFWPVSAMFFFYLYLRGRRRHAAMSAGAATDSPDDESEGATTSVS